MADRNPSAIEVAEGTSAKPPPSTGAPPSSRRVIVAASPPPPSAGPMSRLGRAVALAALALMAWKLKFVLFGLLAKARFLAIGLAQLSALFSVLLSFGAYWEAFGWKLALGVAATMYVHELGHLAGLRRFRVPLRAAMFVPGFGAFVRFRSYPADTDVGAYVALSGVFCGTAAAWGVMLLGQRQHWPSFLAIAHVASWTNLFNLLPVWQLDGSRALRVLSRRQRVFLALLALAAWLLVRDGLLLVLSGIIAFRAWREKAGPRPDHLVLVSLAALLLVLTALLYLIAR